MEWLILAVILAVSMGGLSAWIAGQKRRDTSEGFILGFLFGPFGVLVEALLPQGNKQAGSGISPAPRNIDEVGVIATIADRFRTALEEADPYWESLSYHRKRAILRSPEKQLIKELRLSPTQFSDYAAEARRVVFKADTKVAGEKLERPKGSF